MKTLLAGITGAALLIFPVAVSAQMMGGNGTQTVPYGPGMMGAYSQSASAPAGTAATSSDQGDSAGAALWQKLSSGETNCAALSQSDFEALGDYYMGAMMGNSHDAMDQYMTQSIGQEGDAAMHIAMGERLSGCNTAYAYPEGGNSFFYPMMGGMMGLPAQASGWGTRGGYGTPFAYGMPYDGSGFWWDGLFSVALWIFAIIGVIATIRWIANRRDTK